VEPPTKEFIAFLGVVLITGIVYSILNALGLSVIFVICLDILLVFLGFVTATTYEPKPVFTYAAAAGVLVFLFIFLQNIYYAVV
jgi:hypothetical protein